VCDEQLFDLVSDWPGGGGDFVAGYFAYTDDVAIGGGNKKFVGGVKIFGAKDLLDDVDARFRSDFREDAAGDAFEAAGVERRRIDLAVFDGENIGGGAFGDFAALVEQDHFVETFLLRFGNGPDIGKPGNTFDSGEGSGGVAAVGAQAEANRFVVFGERGGIDDEVDLWLRLVAAPEPDLVVDQIDARTAFGNIVGANDFVQMHADFSGGVRHGEADERGIFFEAAPVALVGEGFAARDADGGEEAPAANESGLSGGQADFLDGQQGIVVEDVAMNQRAFLTLYSSEKQSKGGLATAV
jgi:hypothetical protein